MPCIHCGRGFHDECVYLECINCHDDTAKISKTITGSLGLGAPIKNPDEVGDRHSTGRKRAAQLYPIFDDQPCEWQGKKNCGGGKPIIGCVAGLQADRHHGPIKDTLRNEPGNVHRICKICHNNWHAVNDPIYDEEKYKELPHLPEKATDAELFLNEARRKTKR
jgi:hypothetical protein